MDEKLWCKLCDCRSETNPITPLLTLFSQSQKSLLLWLHKRTRAQWTSDFLGCIILSFTVWFFSRKTVLFLRWTNVQVSKYEIPFPLVEVISRKTMLFYSSFTSAFKSPNTKSFFHWLKSFFFKFSKKYFLHTAQP